MVSCDLENHVYLGTFIICSGALRYLPLRLTYSLILVSPHGNPSQEAQYHSALPAQVRYQFNLVWLAMSPCKSAARGGWTFASHYLLPVFKLCFLLISFLAQCEIGQLRWLCVAVSFRQAERCNAMNFANDHCIYINLSAGREK